MWTLFIKPVLRGGCLAGVMLVLSACATQQTDSGLNHDSSGDTSKYAQQKTGAAAGDSDAVHIPPVPHDDSVEDKAREAAQEYSRALQARANGKNKQALVMFRSLASRYPMLSGPRVNEGLIQLERDQFEAAKNAFEQALQANNANPYAHNGLGLTLREQGQFQQARQHYQQALELDPDYARAHFNLAVLSELYLQDLGLALNHFRRYQALQKEPDSQVANWIVDLERRTPDSDSPVAGQSTADDTTEVN